MNFSDLMFFLKSKPLAVIQGIIEFPKYSIKLIYKGGLKERNLGSFKPSNRDELFQDIANRERNKRR